MILGGCSISKNISFLGPIFLPDSVESNAGFEPIFAKYHFFIAKKRHILT